MIYYIDTDFESTVSNIVSSSKKNRTGLIVGIAVSIVLLCSLSVFAVYCFNIRRKPYGNQDEDDTKAYVKNSYILTLLTSEFQCHSDVFCEHIFPVSTVVGVYSLTWEI